MIARMAKPEEVSRSQEAMWVGINDIPKLIYV